MSIARLHGNVWLVSRLSSLVPLWKKSCLNMLASYMWNWIFDQVYYIFVVNHQLHRILQFTHLILQQRLQLIWLTWDKWSCYILSFIRWLRGDWLLLCTPRDGCLIAQKYITRCTCSISFISTPINIVITNQTCSFFSHNNWKLQT